jgi:hypothetical protein
MPWALTTLAGICLTGASSADDNTFLGIILDRPEEWFFAWKEVVAKMQDTAHNRFLKRITRTPPC